VMNDKNVPDGMTWEKRVMMNRSFLAALAFGLAASTSALAQTEIQWWHAMTGANNEIINKLADEFNASQKDYKVVPSYKGNYADTMNAGIAAFRAGNAPHIMQVFEVGTATMMGAKGAVKPVHEMMKETGEKFDPQAYLPTITGYYSTAKGEMLSFPFNSSSMVMWVNKDELKKAGVNEIPKTWPEVFDAAKKLKAAGHSTCGFSSAWITWGMIEQFSAWHNVPMGTKANGLDGFDTELKFNSPLHVKHLQNLVDLQKDKTFDYSGRDSRSEGRFTSGECAIFLNSSGFYGNVKANAKFDYASAPMPYYPERPGRSAELDHRRRIPVGHGRQDACGIQGRGQVLHLPVRHGPPGQAAPGIGLPADHQGGLREDQGCGLLREEPHRADASARAHQQGADRELPRPALRQHGSDARRLVRGDRGGPGRPEIAQGRA